MICLNDEELITKLKSHIHFEDGMDDSLLSFYIENAENYVKKAAGKQPVSGDYGCRHHVRISRFGKRVV